MRRIHVGPQLALVFLRNLVPGSPMSLIRFLRPFSLAIPLAGVGACAPHAMPLAADHPANPAAEPGRLAGPPSALHAGVAQVDEPARRPSASAPDHSTHGSGPAPATAADKMDAPKAPPAPDAGAHQHGAEAAPADARAAPVEKKPASNKAAPKKPAPKAPAERPAAERPASAPEKPAPAKPAPRPPGHEGH